MEVKVEIKKNTGHNMVTHPFEVKIAVIKTTLPTKNLFTIEGDIISENELCKIFHNDGVYHIFYFKTDTEMESHIDTILNKLSELEATVEAYLSGVNEETRIYSMPNRGQRYLERYSQLPNSNLPQNKNVQ